MKKQWLLLLWLCTCSILVKAQDHIHLKDGTVLDVYIKKITGSVIFYSSTPGSPKRFIKKDAVEKVVYKRGREVMMETPQRIAAEKRRDLMLNRHNTLTLSPLPLMFWGNYSGGGIGVEYERFVDKEKHLLSVHLAGYLGYISNEDVNLDPDEYSYGEAYIVYASPGFRCHLLNPQKRADYAIGVSGLVGNANHTQVYRHLRIPAPDIDEQFLLTAVMLDNDFNFTSKKKKIVIGVHTAFGPVFGDFAKDGKWMGQIGIKLGRRF